MPVTTRSQTKLQCLTGSTDGLSILNSSRIGSTDELSRLPSNPSSSTDGRLPLLNTNTSITCSSHLSSDTSLGDLPLLLNNSSSLEFQTSTLENLNLKISNEHLFPTTVLSSSSPHLSHNFFESSFVNMEDDYNDKASGFAQTSKDMIELQQLFANFTNQMSSHLQQLHSKIADTDERLWQSQASFKQEIRGELDYLRSLLRSTSSTSVQDTAPDSSPDNPISGVTPGLNTNPSMMFSNFNSSSVGNSSSSAHSTDVQGQMMLC